MPREENALVEREALCMCSETAATHGRPSQVFQAHRAAQHFWSVCLSTPPTPHCSC